MLSKLLPLSLLLFLPLSMANTECIWVIGRVTCTFNQTKVVDTRIEVWDKDGPKTPRVKTDVILRLIDRVDPDDKAGVTIVEDETGLFKVEGCASDQDWLFRKNQPEFYLKIFHRCTPNGEEKCYDILPPVKVFVPNTYDKYMNDPIELSLLVR
ncbi:unnamed protein product, partial [Mesorhabditis belari]|uniref:Uncharacterized protein n=1 Tax=Mesorhabditis belari TaxID=2138241 RepID=A0AAF3ERX8_9BILA